MLPGALSIVPRPDAGALAAYTGKVYALTPTRDATRLAPGGRARRLARSRGKVGEPSPIKHVFYIIRENRTYDQVLGDMQEGNGDPGLCLFAEEVTPNAHALAREFVLLDNFYVDAEVSRRPRTRPAPTPRTSSRRSGRRTTAGAAGAT